MQLSVHTHPMGYNVCRDDCIRCILLAHIFCTAILAGPSQAEEEEGQASGTDYRLRTNLNSCWEGIIGLAIFLTALFHGIKYFCWLIFQCILLMWMADGSYILNLNSFVIRYPNGKLFSQEDDDHVERRVAYLVKILCWRCSFRKLRTLLLLKIL